ncbi:MAG: hypothetical protein AAF399_04225 [Bacteroidota bacterium]
MLRLLLLSLCLLGCLSLAAQPISLHPDNPHYLAYQGAPILLSTSAEHYGAVLNQDFDYSLYLQTLEEAGMNYTRIFSGSYVEIPSSFGINNNTLSPAVGKYLTPWQRVEEPGLYEGEGKFDFDQWNPAYFARLKAFLTEAAERGIIVELTFFCATYQDASWERHPFNPANNVNYDDSLARHDFNTRRYPQAFAYQKALVHKLVTELNEFDNLFYELSNEPWSDGNVDERFLLKTLRPQAQGMNWALWVESPTPERMAWQKALAAVVAETEQNLPQKHLVAQNFTNFSHSLPEVDPNISILNFHYAWPEAVSMNYGWDRPINFDESGFAGRADTTYLHQAWAFILAGGAVFNNLDYSFAVGEETGTDTSAAPGGGSARLRSQLAFL